MSLLVTSIWNSVSLQYTDIHVFSRIKEGLLNFIEQILCAFSFFLQFWVAEKHTSLASQILRMMFLHSLFFLSFEIKIITLWCKCWFSAWSDLESCTCKELLLIGSFEAGESTLNIYRRVSNLDGLEKWWLEVLIQDSWSHYPWVVGHLPVPGMIVLLLSS